jgi:hypothetical protein
MHDEPESDPDFAADDWLEYDDRVDPGAMDDQDVYDFILSLPDVTEIDRLCRPAFLVHGKRFAHMFTDEGVTLKIGEAGARAAIAAHPGRCSARFYGGRLTSVCVNFRRTDRAVVTRLIVDAWAAQAPRRLVSADDRTYRKMIDG